MKLTAPQTEMQAQLVVTLVLHLTNKNLFSTRVISLAVEYFVTYMATKNIVRAHAVNADEVADAFATALNDKGFVIEDDNEREAFRTAIRACTKVMLRTEPMFSDF